MFRHASISSIKSCRNLCANTARNIIVKFRPQFITSSCNQLLLTRSESGTCNIISNASTSAVSSGSVSVGKTTASILTKADPFLNEMDSSASFSTGAGAVTEAVVPPGTLSSPETPVDLATTGVAQTLNEQIHQFISKATALPTEVIEIVVITLSAMGEATVRNLGLAINWSSSLIQQALEFLYCDVGLPLWGKIVAAIQRMEQVVTALSEIVEIVVHTYVSAIKWASSYVLQFLEFLHCGLPWWGAIVAGTVVLRLLLFPIIVKFQQQGARIYNNVPHLEALQLKITKAKQSNNALRATRYSNDLAVYTKEKNMNRRVSFLLPVCHTPVFTSFSVALGTIISDPSVDSLRTGGTLWFKDLTLTDPFYILPVAALATRLISVEIMARSANLSMEEKVIKNALRTIPAIGFLFTMNMPAALQCYSVTASFVTLGTVLLLRKPEIRTKLNIENRERDYDAGIAGIYKRAGLAPIIKTYRHDPTKPPPSSRSNI